MHTADGVRAAQAALDDSESGFSTSVAAGKAALSPLVDNKDVHHAA